MHIPVPEDLTEVFTTYKKFIIIGHEEPDGDCLSSQWVLSSFLRRRGADTVTVSPGPFTRNEIRSLEGDFQPHVPGEYRSKDTLSVIVDCSTLDRISYLAKEIRSNPIAVVDHHSSGETFGDIRYIDEKAPSVTYMIQKIMESLGDRPNREEAQILLFGLGTDTGFFRHLEEGSSAVFDSASRLVDAGASPKEVHSRMYGGRALASRVLLGRLLSRTQSFYDRQLLLTYETLEDKKEFGEENRDSDTLYQHLQGVEGCEVVVLIRQEEVKSCSVGLRSKDGIDVGSLARSFGGGGHARAAGFEFTGEINSISDIIVDSLHRQLSSSSSTASSSAVSSTVSSSAAFSSSPSSLSGS